MAVLAPVIVGVLGHQNDQLEYRRRRRQRLRHLVLFHEEVDREPVYGRMNIRVPVLAAFFDGQDLMANYRLSRQSMEALMRILPSKTAQGWSHEVQVLMTVYWLAPGLSYSRLVHGGVENIAALRQEVIRLPAAGDLDVVGQVFARLANSPVFSRCVGSIDGCHVRFKSPPGPGGQDYLNRKLFPSIQLQAVCDGKGFFINSFVGYPGSVHDTRVLKNSRIYKDTLYPPPGYFIVGDGGYPCTLIPVAIITPYKEPLQGRVQSRFNNHHAKARCIIERAFGMLKTRWRSLLFKALEVSHTFVPSVITACAALHNICLTAGDILEPVEDVGDIGVAPPRPVRGVQSGHGQRDRLAGLLSAPLVHPVELQEHDYL
ncbi:putative nuclease HARBI1 [Notolabrus celidotus]|uniref:putative nuclease HARBI1 n=1 Tax=Notolabrus celidotus TaxID=1203425 RepID=UPI00148F889D|nr:putative nuclease HARBI1 [Notolabrus celidotus]